MFLSHGTHMDTAHTEAVELAGFCSILDVRHPKTSLVDLMDSHAIAMQGKLYQHSPVSNCVVSCQPS